MARRPPPVAVQLGGGPSTNNHSNTMEEDAKSALKAVVAGTDDFLTGWRDFAFRKNILDTATGFMIGGALTSIIHSLVDDVLTPLITVAWRGDGAVFDGAFLVLHAGRGGASNVSYATVEAAHADGAIVLNYGRFLSRTLAFVIHSLFIFVLYRLIRRLSHAHGLRYAEAHGRRLGAARANDSAAIVA